MTYSKTIEKLYSKFEETVSEVFKLVSNAIDVKTFFVSRTTEDTFSILNVLNNDGCLIEPGMSLPIEQSY